MVVTPAEQKGYDAIEALIGKEIDWLGDKVEWDARAGKRGRGRSKPSVKPAAKSEEPKHSKKDDAAIADKKPKRKSGGAPQQDVEHSDAGHAFGGEEHIPAFLR